MSRRNLKFQSLTLISLLALPLLYFALILLPMTFFNLLTSWFSGSSTFFSVLGITMLLHLFSPPPPSKKKRIIFVQTFKAIIKRFCKVESSETIVFNDDVVQFAQMRQTPEKGSVYYQIHDLDTDSTFNYNPKESHSLAVARNSAKTVGQSISDPPPWREKKTQFTIFCTALRASFEKFYFWFARGLYSMRSRWTHSLGVMFSIGGEISSSQLEDRNLILIRNKISSEVDIYG
jgi:hypothetical protein